MGIEKRQHPRYRVCLDARVLGFEMSTANLSVTGMQLVCPAMIYEFIKNKLKTETLEACLSLPGEQFVNTGFEVIYITEWAEEFLIGSRFTSIDDEVGALPAYLDRLAKSHTLMA